MFKNPIQAFGAQQQASILKFTPSLPKKIQPNIHDLTQIEHTIRFDQELRFDIAQNLCIFAQKRIKLNKFCLTKIFQR